MQPTLPVALLLGSTLWVGHAPAQALVKDINTVAINPGSDPSGIASVLGGTAAFFGAIDGVNGAELWRTDGTTGATMMVKDINPGSASSSPNNFFSFGAVTLFTANDGVNGTELWITDGTTAGTTLLKDINPGSASSSPTLFILAGGLVFFRATDGTGSELWRTDFSAAGTVQVKDINTTTATASGFPNRFASFNGKAYFAANDGVSGSELWMSDGTAAGTQIVLDIGPGSVGGFPTSLKTVGSRLFFFADDGANGSELWSTDGTSTALVKDINPGLPASASVEEIMVDLGGVLIFTATEASTGHELWRSDGTASGIVLVKDINPGTGNGATGITSGAALLGATVLIGADDGVNGVELWSTDGTNAGTTLVKDMNPGVDSSTPTEMRTNGSRVYMTVYHPAFGVELWSSDGTNAGTQLAGDTFVGSPDGIPRLLANVGPKVVFQAISLISGNREPWVSDSTPAGTFQLLEINPPSPTATTNANPTGLVSFNGKLYFGAGDGLTGTELWVSDGTAAGTQLVLDINPGASSGFNGPLRQFGNKLVFAATTAAAGTELWQTDGTAGGTTMIRDLNPGPANGYNPGSSALIVYGSQILFAGNNGTSGSEPCVSDGTAAGTQVLKDIVPGIDSSSPSNFTAANGLVFFQGLDLVNSGNEPYRTDGTLAGTSLLLDINAGPNSSNPTASWSTPAGSTSRPATARPRGRSCGPRTARRRRWSKTSESAPSAPRRASSSRTPACCSSPPMTARTAPSCGAPTARRPTRTYLDVQRQPRQLLLPLHRAAAAELLRRHQSPRHSLDPRAGASRAAAGRC